MTQYTGRLTLADRQAIDELTAGGMSVRKTATHLDLSYGSVRYYTEWLQNHTADGTDMQPPASGPRILVFDIETAPYLTWNWNLWKANAIDIEQEWYMLSFAYGWYDIEAQEIGPIDFVSLQQDPEFEPMSQNDKHVVTVLWHLFDQAEIVVGQNHERFDIKKANERSFIHGYGPPSPYSTLDTKRIWNRNFSGSAALKYMARKADVALKSENVGFPLWKGCMNNEPERWEQMEEYNRADVVATSEVFTKLIPWIDHPTSNVVNFGHWKRGTVTCTKCMNTENEQGFISRGYHRTKASQFQTLQCKKCGGYARKYQRVPQRHEADKTFLR